VEIRNHLIGVVDALKEGLLDAIPHSSSIEDAGVATIAATNLINGIYHFTDFNSLSEGVISETEGGDDA